MIPRIPIGLSSQILKKKFGKAHATLNDLVLSKIAAEVMLLSIDETLGFENAHHKKVQKKIDVLESKIKKQIEYLKSWYESYFNLAVQCGDCSFNQNGNNCSFYGENKIPFPDPSRKHEECSHRSVKHKSKKIKYHDDN